MIEGLQDRGHLFRVLGRCADRLGDARAGRLFYDGKLQLWDAAMTVWEAGADPSMIFL